MAFKPIYEVPTHQIRRITLANAIGSSTYTVQPYMALQPGATGHAGFATQATGTSTYPVLGVVMALYFKGAKVTELASVVGVNSASSGTQTTIGSVYNDNETYGFWSVDYVPSNLPIDYVADTSAATGTTTDSGGAVYLSLIAATTGVTGGMQLSESTVALFSGTQGQFYSYGYLNDGVNPSNTSKVVGHWSKVL